MKAATDPLDPPLETYMITEDGKRCMGIFKTLFGRRVRAGYYGDAGYAIDWCCGANKFCLGLTFGIVSILLDNRVPFEKIPPMSLLKPWPLDRDFILKVQSLLDSIDHDVQLMKIRRAMVERDQMQNLEFHLKRENYMIKEKYKQEVLAIIDKAAGDKNLSTEDYVELCADVADDLEGRRYAAESDLRHQKSKNGK